ncbi:uncharacterized protein [Drosophila tropicalis]|uniref:uncharacterized protein n=1 Tax=Drosophila tropicalis TaxID=46794 RepID=UPI0035ABF970
MLQELPKPIPKPAVAYALKRRNDKFVVECIVEGIVNPAYEPDLDGDAAAELATQRFK